MKQFCADESGAVTVDWVVLTAGTVGLGLATMAVVSGGIETLSGNVSDQIAATPILDRFVQSALESANDFSNGVGDWVGGNLVNLAGFGEVLQLGPGEGAQMDFAVPEGADSATISFDLIGGDDLSGEPATVFINGDPVAIYADNHGNITTSTGGPSNISVSMTQQFSNDPVGAGSHGHDSRTTITITVDDPTETVSVGVQSGADQGVDNEFYAIDDVNISTN